MIKILSIKNLRAIEELSLNLGRVNLITGKNNVGKSTVLEAAFLLLGAHTPELTVRLNVFRGLENVTAEAREFWGWLFRDFQISRSIAIEAIDESNNARRLMIDLGSMQNTEVEFKEPTDRKQLPSDFSTTKRDLQLNYSFAQDGEVVRDIYAYWDRDRLKIRASEESFFPLSSYLSPTSRIQSELVERFSKLQNEKRKHEVLELIRIIEPKISDLDITVTSTVSSLRCDIGEDYLIPSVYMGDGFNRWLSIVLAILHCKGGVVLVDEIDSGMHYSILSQMWNAIRIAAEASNSQVIATTHSWECIKAAHDTFSSIEDYDFRITRLDRTADGVRAVQFDREQMDTAIATELEIR